MQTSPTLSPECVVAYPRRHAASEHEVATQTRLAHLLARLLDCHVQDSYDAARAASCYYVPDHTLVAGTDTPEIDSEMRLFGGIVPHHFVATKAITHGLWPGASRTPGGWNTLLGESLGDSVLNGYTAFSREDAAAAGRALLQIGPVRIKPVNANAGRGQIVIHDAASLDHAIEACEPCEAGLVLEENLSDVRTFSVGWCRVGAHRLAYVGTQSLTPDNQGEMVYGGSTLVCVPGEAQALTGLSMDADTRRAAELAVRYDAAVSAAYPTLIASRRNYDVVAGRTHDRQVRLGVLEQSWRAGGASVAELCAMLHFATEAGDRPVQAYTRERYGPSAHHASASELVYRGQDSRVGWMTKTGGIVREGSHGAP